MKYKSCKYIQTGIAFKHYGITLCNKIWGYDDTDGTFISYKDNFYDNFVNMRLQAIENCKCGILPKKGCETCMYLEEKEWDDNPQLKEIEITHWTHCNCKCFYCSMIPVTHGKVTLWKKNAEEVEMYPVIKRMLADNLIAEDAFFSITGGEVTMLREFVPILKILLKQENTKYGFFIPTNAILYEKIFADAIRKTGRGQISISIDSGTRETFKLIKGVDKFNDVVRHIKRYVKDCGEESKNVCIKYIILNKVNDTKEAADAWINLCKEMGVKTLHPSVEFCNSIKNSENIFTPKSAEIYYYLKEQIIANGFYLSTNDFLEEYIVKNQTYDIFNKNKTL